jgi:hypothetical protein
MAAPQFGSEGAGLGGAGSAAASIPVPTTPSAAAGVLDLVFLYYEATIAEGSVTVPSGFTEVPDSPIEVNGVGEGFVLRVYGKSATVDTGTYDFTLPISTWRDGVAVRFSGVDTAARFDVTNSGLNINVSTTSPVVSDTTTGADELWVWAVANFQAGSTTFGGSFTKRSDQGEVAIATLTQTSAGPSGSLTATHPSAVDAAWLGALKAPVAAGGPSSGQFFALF